MARRKLSREELEKRYEEKAREAHMFFMCFQSVMSQEYDATTPELKESNGEGKYKFYLIRATSPDTAYILKRFSYPGQKDYTTISRYVDFFTSYWWETWPTEWHAVLEKLRSEYIKLNYEHDLERNRQALAS